MPPVATPASAPPATASDDEQAPPGHGNARDTPLRRRWAALPQRLRSTLAGLALLAAYFLLCLANSPDGFLGTDTGGKVATLKAMAAHHAFANVNVGYWAARWDPTGALHPLYNTLHLGGQWVQVTTLPMLLAGEPLYRLGGYRLTLLLPMLGAVGCAYAARALARRFGGSHARQWWAFWLVGLASPVVIYALDFWEHTLGLALMAWGLIALLDLLDTEQRRRRAALAGLGGLGFGLAATMRTEALVYLAVSAVVIGVVLLARQRRITPWLAPAVSFAVGVVVPLAANRLLSQWVLGDGLRASRAAGAADSLGSSLTLRLREGLVTTFGLSADASTGAILLGVLAAAIIMITVARGRRHGRALERPFLVALLGCLCLLFLVTFSNGLGFVSGITGAAPLAAAGAVAAWRRPLQRAARIATVAVLLSLPVVWAFQWTGGAGPQWGGRYVLLTMLVLVTVGIVALPSLLKPVRRVLIGLSIAVSIFGLLWMQTRTHDVARAFTLLDARPEPVLVADGTLGFFPREGGAFYQDHRWLTTPARQDRSRAASVVRRAGYTTFALIDVKEQTPPRRIGQFHVTATSHLSLFSGVQLTIRTYRLVAP